VAVLDMFRLDGKRALITGGSRGLGRAMAQALAEAGADLVLVGRDLEQLQKARGDIVPLGRKVGIVQADLFTPAAVEVMCRQVLAHHGPIHILINNVGGRRESVKLEEEPLATWTKLMDLNLTSAFICTRELGKPMLERGWGRVINIASISGQVATRNIHGRHYETAKAGMIGFTRAVAADWATRGVTVNAIAPGGFQTDANSLWFRERPELKQQIETMIPMGRLGKPEEIGPLAVYLASEASSYMTGAVIVIDGGKTLW
jgi:NAD(P)-dependent dehydrogenase (short-subunit alcohol dehydrogenase family)